MSIAPLNLVGPPEIGAASGTAPIIGFARSTSGIAVIDSVSASASPAIAPITWAKPADTATKSAAENVSWPPSRAASCEAGRLRCVRLYPGQDRRIQRDGDDRRKQRLHGPLPIRP